ncbi:hypothetical protein CF327_g4440 [Tilletia walkeri]|uniref:DH domain-containing protein n=1 Tax=Tilletia walkeri TaxID=117179 RepID=A0A8X7T5D0_9BASI|nr:hypothetical protein CF327_g4440 [Tilletia walkeri]KAE8268233.1 hypothetical protein A4X09_0g4117 [Tilletia walkeri]
MGGTTSIASMQDLSAPFAPPPAVTPAVDNVDEQLAEEEEIKLVDKAIRESLVEEKRRSRLQSKEQQATEEAIAKSAEEDRIRHALQQAEKLQVERALQASQETAQSTTVEDDGEDSDASTTGWTSSEDEDDDTADAEDADTPESRQQREVERLRVLEAAGILVHKESSSKLSKDTLRRMATKGKPKPERPERPSRQPARTKKSSDLPPLPVMTLEAQLEDAYTRFEQLNREVSLKPLPVLSLPGSPLPGTAALLPGSPESRPDSRTEPRQPKFLSSILNISKNHSGRNTPGERRATPTISGPISAPSQQGTDQQGQYAQPSTSWSSLVGPQAVAMIDDKERKRQEAIFELTETERTHVRDLQIVIEVFFNPLQMILAPKAARVIFAGVEEVMTTAAFLLSDLEDRQRQSRLLVEKVGDIIINHIQAIHATYLPLCANQSAAMSILEAEREGNETVRYFLQNVRENHPAARHLDLSHFLLLPMQRVTRYPLLLGQVLRYTSEDHPDYGPLSSALKRVEGVVMDINETIREREMREQLHALSAKIHVDSEARLDLTAPTQFMGRRRIIKSDRLSKAKSGRQLDVILCSDLVLLMSSDRLYRLPMSLEEIEFREVPSRGRDETTFQLRSAGESINLRCRSAAECAKWTRALRQAQDDCMAARRNWHLSHR